MESYGIAKSSVSRQFVAASSNQLRSLCERRLEDLHLVVLMIDEPAEQRRAIFGGGWGEKGAGQGEHRSNPHSPDTVRANPVSQGWRDVRVVASLAIHPRWEPYALTRPYGSVRGAVSNGFP